MVITSAANFLTRMVLISIVLFVVIVLFLVALTPLRMFVAAFDYAELTKHGSWDPYKVWHSKQFQDWSNADYWLVAAGLDFLWIGVVALILIAICCICTSARIACVECCYKIPNDITFWFYDRQGEMTGYNPKYAELGNRYNSKSESLSALSAMD